MGTEEFRAVVVGHATTIDRLAQTIKPTDVIIVVNNTMSPIRMLSASSVLEEIQHLDRHVPEPWWTEHGRPRDREVLAPHSGLPVERVRFEMGFVNRAGVKYTIQAVDAGGPFAGQLPGEQDRAFLYIECDQYQHPNIVPAYEPGMLCEDEHPQPHPIRDED